jgi:hypothetical protein
MVVRILYLIRFSKPHTPGRKLLLEKLSFHGEWRIIGGLRREIEQK